MEQAGHGSRCRLGRLKRAERRSTRDSVSIVLRGTRAAGWPVSPFKWATIGLAAPHGGGQLVVVIGRVDTHSCTSHRLFNRGARSGGPPPRRSLARSTAGLVLAPVAVAAEAAARSSSSRIGRTITRAVSSCSWVMVVSLHLPGPHHLITFSPRSMLPLSTTRALSPSST